MTADARPEEGPVLRFLSVSASATRLAEAQTCLTAEEAARSLRFLRQADRDRFALGRFLLRSTLVDLFGAGMDGVVIEPDPNGKPLLRSRPDIGINLSHSGDLVLVGVGAGLQVGVDVERHRDDVDLQGVGRVVFAPSERAAVLRGDEPERRQRFFRQWALKEAVVKALGTGLMREPRRFAVDASVVPARLHFVGDGADDIGTGWHLDDVAVPEGYSAAVAWRRLARQLGEPDCGPPSERG